MALSFPNNPVDGQIYEDYIYDATLGAWNRKANLEEYAKLNSPVFTGNVTIPALVSPLPLTSGGTGSATIAGAQTNLQIPQSQNYILNGDMEVNQRGLTSTPVARQGWNIADFGPDRWKPNFDNDARYSRTAVSDISVPSRFAIRVSSVTTSSAYPSYMSCGQKLESINVVPLRGKTVTMSFYIRFSNATFTTSPGGNPFDNFRYELGYYTSTTDSSFAQNMGGNLADSYTFGTLTNGSLPTSWTRVSLTGVVPTNTNNISLGFRFFGSGFTASLDTLWYEITGIQLEEGSVATPFRRNAPSIQAELAACQRYYARLSQTAFETVFGTGIQSTTTNASIFIPLPVTMRTIPTSVIFSGVFVGDQTAWASAATLASINRSNQYSLTLAVTFSPAQGAGTRPVMLQGRGGTGPFDSYVEISAEL